MLPNIVFIVADDLGYADLSCCGRRDFSTPNIDRIAERGLRFTQACANSAVCSATRLALITGRYQYRLPLGLEEPLAGKTDVGLPPAHPSLLRGIGYGTTLVGKWHLGLPPSFGPRQSGYDRFWGILSGAVDYDTHVNSRGEPDLWDGDEAASAAGYLTDLLGDRGRDRRPPRPQRAAFLVEPALQRAALALGGAGRRGGGGAAARHPAAASRRRHAADLCAHGAGDGPADRPGVAGARRDRLGA
jgi:arylsulfatase A-like enzyme